MFGYFCGKVILLEYVDDSVLSVDASYTHDERDFIGKDHANRNAFTMEELPLRGKLDRVADGVTVVQHFPYVLLIFILLANLQLEFNRLVNDGSKERGVSEQGLISVLLEKREAFSVKAGKNFDNFGHAVEEVALVKRG